MTPWWGEAQRRGVMMCKPDCGCLDRVLVGAVATILLATAGATLQGCWLSASYDTEQPFAAIDIAPLPQDIMMQTQEEAERKRVGCVGCHGQTDAPAIQLREVVRLGCAGCRGVPSGVV